MNVRYEIVRLVRWLVVAVGLALVLAVIAAIHHGGGFRHWLELCCYGVALLIFVMAALGNSPGRSYGLDVESSLAGSSRWDTVVGKSAVPPGGALAPGVPLLVVGATLILVGLALWY